MIRKNAAHLTTMERDDFIERLLKLKNTPSPEDPGINIYDQYVALHRYVRSINPPGPTNNIDMAHGSSGFLAWHRYYLLRFEQALQAMKPDVPFALPYWDWTEHGFAETVIFRANFMGPNGGRGGVGGGTVQLGYFRYAVPVTQRPAWWPAGLPGWRIRASLDGGLGSRLRRNFGDFSSLATPADINDLLNRPTFANFRSRLERGNRLHNSTHIWFGNGSSHMRDSNVSPNDPIFWLHHCNVDRLWAMWQIDGHQGEDFYPGPGATLPAGHDQDDPMWPWIGTLTGYSSNNTLAGVTLPDFTGEPTRTPGDVLNHQTLGYTYDTEVAVGVSMALRQARLTSLTPGVKSDDTGPKSKWDSAKAGLSALLHDCEAAYAARRGYVMAGVKTIQSQSINTPTATFADTPYGLIKNSALDSRALFDTTIEAMSLSGEAPAIGIKNDVEPSIARPYSANKQATSSHHSAQMNDAIPISPATLRSVARERSAEDVIFAMEFSEDGDWNGANFAASVKGKQKKLGESMVKNQIDHCQCAGAINNFFTNPLASALNYEPAINSSFELFPGEHLHFPFSVIDADESFMITVQGFDFIDRHWDLCLMPPVGGHCFDTRGEHHDNSHHSKQTGSSELYFYTLRRSNGRFTVFLDRGGSDSKIWVGQWSLMVYYRVDPIQDDGAIQMPNVADLLVPTTAPPLRGPLYAQCKQPPEERQAVRTLPGGPAHHLAPGISGLSLVNTANPCTVAVNIFSRSRVKFNLELEGDLPCTGDNFTVRLRFADMGGGRFDKPFVVGRLIAPAHSIGNAFADQDTIPIESRKKYISQAHDDTPSFDYLRYLADYESARPEVFAIRDQVLNFKEDQDGSYYATISGNRYPGAHRIAVYIETRLVSPENYTNGYRSKPKPQSLERVLNMEVVVGMRPDATTSRPLLHWIARDRLVICVTPTDHLGNIANPALSTEVQVLLGDDQLSGIAHDPYTGERQVELRLLGESFSPSPDGQHIVDGIARIETDKGAEVIIGANENLEFAVSVAGMVCAVKVPSIVGNCRTQTAYDAGSLEAMHIPLEYREVFFSAEAARTAGYIMNYSQKINVCN